MRRALYMVFPKHSCYVEVFGGSFTVWAGKPTRTSKVEVINDINEDLIHLMRVISACPPNAPADRDRFMELVSGVPPSRKIFQDLQKRDVAGMSSGEQAFRYFYCIKLGFSSQLTGGFASSPFGPTRYNMKADLNALVERFQRHNAIIEGMDFTSLVDKYNKKESRSFFFCDPPYFVANDTNYYECVFDNDDHLRFKKSIDSIAGTGNKFLITYDDVPEVIDLYKGYNIYRTSPLTYSAAAEQETREITKAELFISNYDLFKVALKKVRLSRGGQNVCDNVEETSDGVVFVDKGNKDNFSLTRVVT